MKKIVILAVIACLGLGAGIYTAKKTQNINLATLFKSAEKQEAQAIKAWNVVHPSWKGQLVKKGENRVRSLVNGDMATIISDKNGILTVKWDKWGSES
ncbi:MAG: hypothetical protein ACI4QM_04690, partial [Alphaproteobacteria bacterium]